MTPRLATPPEPIWYPLPGEDAESPQWQTASFEGILASAFEANQLGADMLKVEFPGYVDSQPGRDNAVAACKELDAGVNVPWVIRPGKSALAEAVAERNLSPGSCGGTYRCLMRLLSVNVGKPFPNPWKPVALTGIDTFQGWLARADWIKRFTEAARPGAYLRVIDPGQIRAGDSVRIEHRPDHEVTVAVAFRALTIEPDLLPRLPAADALPEEVKDLARKRT